MQYNSLVSDYNDSKKRKLNSGLISNNMMMNNNRNASNYMGGSSGRAATAAFTTPGSYSTIVGARSRAMISNVGGAIYVNKATADLCSQTYPLQHHHVTDGKITARASADTMTSGLSYKTLQGILNDVALESSAWASANSNSVDAAMVQQKLSFVDVHTLYERLSPYVTYYGRLVSSLQLKACVLKMKLTLANRAPVDLYDDGPDIGIATSEASRSVLWYGETPVEIHSFSESADDVVTPKMISSASYRYPKDAGGTRIFPFKSKIKCELCQQNVFMQGEPVAFIPESSCAALFHQRCVVRNYRAKVKRGNGGDSSSSCDEDEEKEGIRMKAAVREDVVGFKCPCVECGRADIKAGPVEVATNKYFYYYTVPYDASPTSAFEGKREFPDKKAIAPPSEDDPPPDCEDCLHNRGMTVVMHLKKNGRTGNMYYGCPYWHVYKCKPKYFNVNPYTATGLTVSK